MKTSKKAKTSSVAALEVQPTNHSTGDSYMKNDITLVNKSQLTMSSREIAELTNKEHRNVKRDVQNKQQVEYLLPKKYIECLLTGYSIPLRMKVIDRLYQLEEANKQSQLKLPTTKELALMVIQAEEENERLMIENKTLGSQLEEMKPTVAAFDRIATKAEGSMCITDTAKHLQVQPRKFFQELNLMGWIYKRTGGHHWLGYQDKVKQGLLEHKITTVSRSDGSEKIVEQVLVTPKGLAKLSQILSQEIAA
jgi:phage antirepressor YoqD-like protein